MLTGPSGEAAPREVRWLERSLSSVSHVEFEPDAAAAGPIRAPAGAESIDKKQSATAWLECGNSRGTGAWLEAATVIDNLYAEHAAGPRRAYLYPVVVTKARVPDAVGHEFGDE